MKKLKYILPLMAGLMLGTSSCDLDEVNPSGTTADVIWSSSPENFLTLVNAAYDRQRYWYGKVDGVFMGETGTDLWFNRDKRLWAAQFSQYNNLDDNTGFVRNVWREFYYAINHCNAGIERIKDVPFTNEAERNRREAELRFMRAFYYWHIVEQYGEVVLRTTETKEAIFTAQRSSYDDFYNVILSDLQFAAEHLPNDWGNEYSRATKKAAYGFLARAALSRAYYGGNSNQYFQMARDAANEIINRKAEFGVELWNNYHDLWNPNNNRVGGRMNPEAIYVISNSRTNPGINYDNNANTLHQIYLTPYTGKPGLVQSMAYGRDNGRQLMPTLALLDFFDEEKDARYYGSFQEVWIANNNYTWTQNDANRWGKDASVVGRQIRSGIDTAMLITKKSIPDKATRPYVVIDRDEVYNTTTGSIRTGLEYVVLKKYMDPITRSAVGSQAGFLDIMVMRLAEIYLIAAEAEYQLGNPGAAASHINVLRTRAAIKTPVDYTQDMQVTAADIDLDFILDERARELCGELIRWFDLKRTGKLGDRISRFNPDITEFQEYHKIRPVPRTELDAMTNAEQFGQNPGYGGFSSGN